MSSSDLHEEKNTMEDGSSRLLLTLLLCPLVLHYLLAPRLLRLIGLPPLPVMVRTVRPYSKLLLVIAWMFYRTKWGQINKWDDVIRPNILSQYGFDEHDVGLLDITVHALGSACKVILSSFRMNPTIEAFLVKPALLLLNDIVGLIFLQSIFSSIRSLRHFSFHKFKDELIQQIFEFAKEHVSYVQKQLEEEEKKMTLDMEKTLKDVNRTVTKHLPYEGKHPEKIIAAMEQTSKKEDSKWKSGLVSGAVYSGEIEHTRMLNSVYASYSLANPLHTDLWPSINQYEAEIASMTAGLLNGGDDNVVGATSSGGTESIILAVKAHRDYYGRKRGIRNPEVVCCTTAHAGIDKACDMLRIRKITIPADPVTFQLRPSDVERSITSDTILIYASAPNFPQGVIDPIEELSALAVRYGVGLHVDACLGGFVLPFAKKLGYSVPKFDFECKGVTSMSVDTHKYGYASKGTSVVLYRHKALRRAQYFSYAQWPGGLYSTPTIAGSRPGALLACAWASLISLGESGYLKRVKSILDTTQKIANAVSNIPGLYLLGGGKPQAMIVCFGSKEFNIYQVGDKMSKLGWSLNSLQRPASLHLCVTLKTVDNADKFISALKDVVEEVKKEGSNGQKEGSAAIYGMAGSMPAGPVEELLRCYTDVTLTP